MAGIRIRWRGVARVAAIVVVALIALRLLPGLLRAPEPPPLAADVGLPRVTPVSDVPRRGAAELAPHARRHRADRPREQRRPHRRRVRSRPTADRPASKAVIRAGKPAEATRPPVPEYSPPVAPEAAPEPLAEPSPSPPSTPGDGSQEFAPH